MAHKFIFLLTCFCLPLFAQTTIHLWPGQVPGETKAKAEPTVSDNRARNVTRLSEVTDPMLSVYRPDSAVHNGAGIIICPGGGYRILAIDLEGHEVAEWLSGLGYTAFVLYYRVPQKQNGALMDVQRAIRMVRSRSDEWQLNPEKISVLGFSAGGSLAARASTRYQDSTYQPVDAADSLSCKPDFSVLIYPAYLDHGPDNSLTTELKVDSLTPPAFLFATADDNYANSSLVMAGALNNANVPVELHLMPSGGHGYGLRPGNPAAEAWPGLAERWLERTVLVARETRHKN